MGREEERKLLVNIPAHVSSMGEGGGGQSLTSSRIITASLYVQLFRGYCILPLPHLSPLMYAVDTGIILHLETASQKPILRVLTPPSNNYSRQSQEFGSPQ